MLGGLLGDLLPAALAVALSPIPVVAVVLILAGPRARATGPAFAGGWIAGLTVVAVAVTLLLGGVDGGSAEADGVLWFKVAAGLGFLGLALRKWRSRPEEGAPEAMPAWMETIATAPPGRGVLLGAVLAGANPKNIVLTLAAAGSIAEGAASDAERAIALAVYVALGSASVAGAVLLFLVDEERAAGPLAAVRRFMAAHSTAIAIVVLLLLGAKLLGDGLRVL